jgi:hypothetical protein
MKNISRAEFVRQMTPGLELTFRSSPNQSAERTVLKANAGRVQFTTAKGTISTLSFESGDKFYETETGWAVQSGDMLMEYHRGHPEQEQPGSTKVHGNTGTSTI